MDGEVALLGISEYSVGVVGLVSFLLHCNASNLVVEILKHDKIWGTICSSVPTLNYGDCPPPYPSDIRPWAQPQ